MKTNLVIEVPVKIKKGWSNSPIKDIVNQSGQFKNKFGTKIVEAVLDEKEISHYLDKNENVIFGDNCVSEIRTAFASIQGKTKTFWFNQIRPNVKNWTHLHLVCVHPEKIDVYQYSKEDCLELCRTSPGLDHIGQDGDLLAIKVQDNEKIGTYWKLDCYGTHMGQISTNLISVVNE
jgi:hypothetical protein